MRVIVSTEIRDNRKIDRQKTEYRLLENIFKEFKVSTESVNKIIK